MSHLGLWFETGQLVLVFVSFVERRRGGALAPIRHICPCVDQGVPWPLRPAASSSSFSMCRGGAPPRIRASLPLPPRAGFDQVNDD